MGKLKSCEMMNISNNYKNGIFDDHFQGRCIDSYQFDANKKSENLEEKVFGPEYILEKFNFLKEEITRLNKKIKTPKNIAELEISRHLLSSIQDIIATKIGLSFDNKNLDLNNEGEFIVLKYGIYIDAEHTQDINIRVNKKFEAIKYITDIRTGKIVSEKLR